MNNKGFTLIEILAMLVVLGILMAVSVPNITGMIANQRYNAIKNDATNLIDKAKVVIANDKSIKYPAINNCTFFSLNYLDNNDDFKEGPNGKEYDRYESFVLVRKEGKQYKFYTRLVEKTNDATKFYGINLKDRNTISQKEVVGVIETNINALGLTNDKNNNVNKLKADTTVKTKCNNGNGILVTNYYN